MTIAHGTAQSHVQKQKNAEIKKAQDIIQAAMAEHIDTLIGSGSRR